MLEIKNSKQVQPGDRIRFRCKRCGECCRHVKGAVILESIDAYRLAKHLGISMTEVYEQYADPFILDESGYPIFALKVKGARQECMFLDGNRCTVRPARPRACRHYLFWVEPTDGNGGMEYNYCYERQHHPNGTLFRVKDWMAENLLPEEREYLTEEFNAITGIAPLLHEAKKAGVALEEIQKVLLFYRYFCFETDSPFMEQYRRNNKELPRHMMRLIAIAKNEGGNT